MRKSVIILLLVLLLTGQVHGLEGDPFGAEQVRDALPETAAELMEDCTAADPGGLSDGVQSILLGAMDQNRGAVQNAMALCCQILAIVLLSAVLRGTGGAMPDRAMALSAVLAVGLVCAGRISGLFSLAARTIDDMAAFAGFLFLSLASATAATGAVGTSSSLYGGTVLLCSLMTRGTETLILPGVSCYMALTITDSALGDGGLKLAGDTLKQLLTSGLKLAVLAFTAYLSITGVVSGSADTATVKATKLALSSAVPVVGSMIADASETLLVSAGLLRSSLGVFGLLGVLAVSAGPFMQTGCQYLMLKGTAAAAGIVGEKELSGLISAMAGAMGLLAGFTGACALMLMISCVCFMRAVP